MVVNRLDGESKVVARGMLNIIKEEMNNAN